jgi:hypothetical protein
MKSTTGIIENYIKTIRDLINSKVRGYQEPTKKYKTFSDYIEHKLGFSKSDEWNFFCACMDLVEDTNLAIENFIKFKVEGPTKYNDVGEKYLRLYGFLNATYIQQNALLTLCEVFKISNLKSHQKAILDLKIREIRNKLASHSNSYGKSKKEPIFLARIGLSGTKVTYGSGCRGKFETLDLSNLLQEHLKTIIEMLDLILEKGINYIYQSNKKLKKTYIERLEDIRQEKKGNFVIKLPKGKKIVIISHF